MKRIIKLDLGIDDQKKFKVNEILSQSCISTGDPLLTLSCRKEIFTYNSPVNGFNFYCLVKKGEKISLNTPIFTYCPEEKKYSASTESYIDKKFWNLAIAVNAAFKGLLGSMGESGQIAARTLAVKTELALNLGVAHLINDIADKIKSYELEEGDVVVVAEKLYAVAQKRLLPIRFIYERDPKKMSSKERLIYMQELSDKLSTPLEEEDLLLADAYTEDVELGAMCTMGAYNHNLLAFNTAEALKEKTGKSVDVVISDTDTGMDVCKTLIGCITIGATPIGATKGLNLYECMRAACAAEFTRGSKRRTPVVICKPAPRARLRKRIGKFRGYNGKLSYKKEGKLAFI